MTGSLVPRTLTDYRRFASPRFVIHDMRDTFISVAKECGAVSEIVDRIVGHKPQGVSGKHYESYTLVAMHAAQNVLPYRRGVA